jgi:hypothetical protein
LPTHPTGEPFVVDFKKSKKWLVDNMGKYVPYLNQDELDSCVIAAKVKYGRPLVRLKMVPYYEDDPFNKAWLSKDIEVGWNSDDILYTVDTSIESAEERSELSYEVCERKGIEGD